MILTLLTFILSVFPGLLICFFIIKLDKHEKEPLPLLAISLALGVGVFFVARFAEGYFDEWMLSYFNPEGRIDFNPNTNWGTLFISAFFRAGFIEEFFKLAVLLLIPFHFKQFNESIDGIVYAVMIGMGFATVENAYYCMPNNEFILAAVRDLTAVPSHGVFGVILGYYVGLAKSNKNNIQYILTGFLLTVGVHGLYDIFLFQEFNDWMMILATGVLLAGFYFSYQLINAHQENSPFEGTFEEYSITPSKKITDTDEEENEILSGVLSQMKKEKKDQLNQNEND